MCVDAISTARRVKGGHGPAQRTLDAARGARTLRPRAGGCLQRPARRARLAARTPLLRSAFEGNAIA